MTDRIEKNWKDLDLEKVDFSQGGNWNWSRGGLPLLDYEYAISHYSENGTETRYKLPPCINKMLKQQYSLGANEARRKIRSALIDD